MKLYTIKSDGLAHNSYYISDQSEAVVIDPRRDCRIYTRIERKECTKIRYILETHRHEDFVVGSLELQHLTKAEICHSKELNFKYGEHKFEDGENLNVGNLKIAALHTPGHTDESLCYVVSGPKKNGEAIMAFTGDTLFVGSVGRTDLYGKDAQPKQAEKLHNSLIKKLLPIGDHVIVYPAHGAGSVCGSEIRDQEFSTLGFERKTNPYLSLSKEAFVKRAVAEELLVPPHFAKMEELNLKGASPLRGLAPAKALSVDEFETETHENDSVVIDTRLPAAFAGSHIPGSLSLWLGGTSAYPSWILSYDQRVLLVVEGASDVKRVQRHFWRLGFDNIYGFLCPSINEWQELGKPISHLGVLSASELNERLRQFIVLDVREPREWKEEGYIAGAERMFFGHLDEKAESMERNKRYAVICSVGKRASIAASILKRKGFIETYNVLGGMTAWNNLGYPVKKN